MKIKEIMHKDPCFLHKGASLAEAAQLMWDQDIGAVLIADDNGYPVGMITDRDIAMAALTQGKVLADIAVATSMSKRVLWCDQNDDILKAQEIMREHQIRRLPVVDNGSKLVGILSLNDIAVAYASNPKRDVKPDAVADTLAAISKHRTHMGQPKKVA